jgi:cysteinyl-tRNA synthetase
MMDWEVLIVFSFAAFVLSGIYRLIKMKMQSGNAEVDEETFDRLARAFIDHKKEMTKRVENLESIVADTDSSMDDNLEQIEAPKHVDQLTNDLNQKQRARS